MNKIKQVLLILIIFTQVLLFSSYYYLIAGKEQSIFWGNIPNKDWTYFLVSAGIAYIFNLALFLYFVFKTNIPDDIIFKVIITLLIYYGLQMYFIPLVLKGNKSQIRLLLFMCILPIAYLAYLAIIQAQLVSNTFEKVFLYIAGLLPLLHVAYNDFYKWGFSF